MEREVKQVIENIISEVKDRNKGEYEFHQTVEEVLSMLPIVMIPLFS